MTPRMIERVTDRLASLWLQSKDPQEQMQWASNRMVEWSLSLEQPEPGQSPQAFARVLIADNPVMVEHLKSIRVELRPEYVETPEELVEMLLPSESGSE